MEGKICLLLCLSSALAEQLCKTDSPNGYKVRLSIQSALGKDAYDWNENEKFLFRSTLAYAMRQQVEGETFQESNVQMCEETHRVSFWFVVTWPSNTSSTVGKAVVEKALRRFRPRFNSAFLLTDQTLEFVGLRPTLQTPVSYHTEPWLIVFAVLMSLICVSIILLTVVSRMKKMHQKSALVEQDGQDVVGFTQM